MREREGGKGGRIGEEGERRGRKDGEVDGGREEREEEGGGRERRMSCMDE